MKYISVRGARQHNLKNIDLDIPRNSLTVVTGLSGSGKSSLAFDTLYAEGQRRYIESLSTYARQFLEQIEKPDVDSIEGLSPAISIEQKTTSRNARSTVGTITEVYDYLRLLFASIGTPHCPNCGQPISRQSVDQIVEQILHLPDRTRISLLAPVVRERKGEFKNVFERFHREGFLRARVNGSFVYLEEPPSLDRRKNHSLDILIDRLPLERSLRERVENGVRLALQMTGGLVTVAVNKDPDILFSEKMACIDCGINVPTLEPRSFSFNSRFGACQSCDGLGVEFSVRFERLVRNPQAVLEDLELALPGKTFFHFFRESLRAILKLQKVAEGTKFQDYPEPVLDTLEAGSSSPLAYRYGNFVYRSQFQGLNQWFAEQMQSASSDKRKQLLRSFLTERGCRLCQGSRLRPDSRAVRVQGRSIDHYCRLTLQEASEAFQRMALSGREEKIAGPLLEEIHHRLRFMMDLGLSYLTLDRAAGSLSGGEAQRIRLATQVGSRLKGVLYVLDEPSIGLHPRDTGNLLSTLKRLRDLGNTIIVVEHDGETIRNADYVIDLGPGAGSHGGKVVAMGTLPEILQSGDSLTASYLRRDRCIEPPQQSRSGNGRSLEVRGARHNNLRNINVGFPLGLFIVVTGVSGSGKSSLVDEVLYRALARQLYGSQLEPGPHREIRGLEHVDKVIEIDQSSIGRTPRSNPATYTGVFTPIRELFSLLPDSRVRGYKPGRFSFNVKGGRCEVCRGDGMRKIEMNFLPDVYVECEACLGQRYNKETLAIHFKGHSIADILDMNVSEAYSLLENFPRVQAKLKTLLDVGLGYVSLGQPAPTLSGGEAQRVKLSRELSKRATGRTLYILDEPTTGLHFEDVRRLLDILHELVDLGNTVIVIEHNLEVIKCADWIIDLGPGGGKEGGELVATGPPQEITHCEHSFTGHALDQLLKNSRRESADCPNS